MVRPGPHSHQRGRTVRRGGVTNPEVTGAGACRPAASAPGRGRPRVGGCPGARDRARCHPGTGNRSARSRARSRDVGEGGEGQSGYPVRPGPVADMVQQRTPDAAPRAVRVHRHLLDVQVVVDVFRDEVRHRPVDLVDRDPGQADPLIVGEVGEREGLVVGDLRHADVGETPPGGALDVLKEGSSSMWTARMRRIDALSPREPVGTLSPRPLLPPMDAVGHVSTRRWRHNP